MTHEHAERTATQIVVGIELGRKMRVDQMEKLLDMPPIEKHAASGEGFIRIRQIAEKQHIVLVSTIESRNQLEQVPLKLRRQVLVFGDVRNRARNFLLDRIEQRDVRCDRRSGDTACQRIRFGFEDQGPKNLRIGLPAYPWDDHGVEIVILPIFLLERARKEIVGRPQGHGQSIQKKVPDLSSTPGLPNDTPDDLLANRLRLGHEGLDRRKTEQLDHHSLIGVHGARLEKLESYRRLAAPKSGNRGIGG